VGSVGYDDRLNHIVPGAAPHRPVHFGVSLRTRLARQQQDRELKLSDRFAGKVWPHFRTDSRGHVIKQDRPFVHAKLVPSSRRTERVDIGAQSGFAISSGEIRCQSFG
jgi:hypothetical protein